MTADGMIEVTLRVSGVSRTQLIDPDVDAVLDLRAGPAPEPDGRQGHRRDRHRRTAAAIGNAVYHAPGRRVRDLPITPPSFTSDSTPAKLHQ